MWKSGWCGGGLGWIKGAEGDDGYFVKVCKKWQTFWCFKKLIKKDLTREVRKLSIFILFPFYIFMATCEEFANPRNPPSPILFSHECVFDVCWLPVPIKVRVCECRRRRRGSLEFADWISMAIDDGCMCVCTGRKVQYIHFFKENTYVFPLIPVTRKAWYYF